MNIERDTQGAYIKKIWGAAETLNKIVEYRVISKFRSKTKP